MQSTKISWAKVTWNPIHGCSKVGTECEFCYAESLSLRYNMTNAPWTRANAAQNVRLKPHKLREPLRLKEPSEVFVNSMSDLFHPLVPDAYIHQIFDVMEQCPQHTFQVLTKRPERAAKWSRWLTNVHMGASIGIGQATKRLEFLRACKANGAAIVWVSAEPLIGAWGNVDISGIDWVVVGGESGQHMAKAERMRFGGDPRSVQPRWLDMAWAREIRDLCVANGTAFYFKQDSGIRTEMRPWLIESDGSRWQWHQKPGQLIDPVEVK